MKLEWLNSNSYFGIYRLVLKENDTTAAVLNKKAVSVSLFDMNNECMQDTTTKKHYANAEYVYRIEGNEFEIRDDISLEEAKVIVEKQLRNYLNKIHEEAVNRVNEIEKCISLFEQDA